MNIHSSIIHHSLKTGNNPNVHQLVNGYIKCGLSLQCNTIPQQEGNKLLVNTITSKNLKTIMGNGRNQT